MATIINTTVTERRGVKRVWFEGRKLLREGFSAGVTYSRTISNGQIKLVVDNTGEYVVSRRKRRNSDSVYPLIDITSKAVADTFGSVEKVRIVIRRGVITITAQALELKMKERAERLHKKIAAGEPLSIATLFHGGGVLDSAAHHGLKSAGVDSYVGLVVEIEDKYLESSLENNTELWRPDSVVVHSAIENTISDIENIKAELLIAALPCTGASKSGKSKNKIKFAEEHSAAGGMFYYFLRYVEVVNPAIIQIENVQDYQGSASMAAIRNVLESLGYDLQERVFNGTEFGALEARERLCVVAVTKGLNVNFELNAVATAAQKPCSLAAVLEDLPLDDARWKEYDYLATKEARDISNGKGFKRQLLTPESTHCGTIGRGYNKCRSTEPFISHPTNPRLSRLLTVAEHAAVKMIPVNIVNGLSDTIAHEVLGQSVIYNFFFEMYKSLAKAVSLVVVSDERQLQSVA